MKNKKGFTLTELLATIVILSIIAAVAIPGTLFIANRLKTNMYCTKVEIIENDAKLWGEENMDTLSQSDSYQTATSGITIEELMDLGYIKEDDIESGEVINPVDNSSMNTEFIKVYKKNNRVYAKIPSAVEKCD